MVTQHLRTQQFKNNIYKHMIHYTYLCDENFSGRVKKKLIFLQFFY